MAMNANNDRITAPMGLSNLASLLAVTLLANGLFTPASQAADYTWNVASGNMTDAANWDPSAGAPPKNGATAEIGGGASVVTATLNGNLWDPDADPAQTAPAEIRILENGQMSIANVVITREHNLVLDGGELRGGVWGSDYQGTLSLIGDSLVRDSWRLSGLVQDGDETNPGRLIHQTGSTFRLSSANNTYSGGTVVQGGTLSITQLGAMGTGDVVVEGGTLEFRQINGSVFNGGVGTATITAEAGSTLNIFQAFNWDNATLKDGVTISHRTQDWSYQGGMRGNLTLEGTITYRIDNAHATRNLDMFLGDSTTTITDGTTPGKLVFEGFFGGEGLTRYIQFAGSNTFSGGVEVVDTRVSANDAGTLGTGDVLIHADVEAVLRLAHNDAIDPGAWLTLLEDGGDHGVVVLDDVDVTVLGLTLGTTSIAAGTYSVGSTTLGDFFTGTGSITVIPEPASAMLVLMGSLLIAARRRQRGQH